MNTSTPFDLNEHNGIWKNPNYMPWNFTEYKDFTVETSAIRLPFLFKADPILDRSSMSATRLVLCPLFGRTMGPLLQ